MLRCPYGRDIIVRVKKSRIELLLGMLLRMDRQLRKNEKVFLSNLYQAGRFAKQFGACWNRV